ncbi:hypothetical protein LIER_07842 [Lithospermum erythrorhizon]|uniref:DUF4283 domain-containing protein n=1 Tax=Lithospermum erythrorhizon TaxID=34254 RepID=A0AAV3PAF6_LITER
MLVNFSDLVNSAGNQGGEGSQSAEPPLEAPINHNNQGKTYADIVSAKNVARMNLTFIPPEEVNGKAVVKYQSTDVMPSINWWKSATYGYVMGLNPNFITIEQFVESRWKGFGFKKMYKLAFGLFLFQFEDDTGCDRMIVEGSWTFAQYPMILNLYP